MSILIGLPAPEFHSPALMPDGSIDYDFSLSSYRKQDKCVVFFYAMNFAQVDPTELIALHRAYKAFEERGVKIIAISTDTFMSHKMWQKIPAGKGGVGRLPFPMVSDYTKSVAKGYDVIMNDTFAMRATFILDHDGYVRHQSINDFSLGRNIHEIIRIIDAMDFHLQTEQLCPANWQVQSAGIAIEDEFAREYFSAMVPSS